VTARALRGRTGSAAIWVLRRSWLFVLFLVAWEINFRLRESIFVPPMTEIVGGMLSKWFSANPLTLFTSEFFREHAVVSLVRLAWGWGIAIVAGVGAGLLLGSFRSLEALSRWVLRFGLSTPSTVLLPLALVLFGITNPMYVFLVAVGTVWPILLNTMDGVRGIDAETKMAARSLRLGGWRLFRRVTLPAASPQIFAGLRVSMGIALILVVVSEIFVGTRGIGFDIILSQRTFRFDEMWSSVALIAVIALVLNGLFHRVEARVLHWHQSHREAET